MRSIVQRILNAEVPVIVYVAPTGARAASAGVFITMAAHVAAMAPATNIGAAHPVAVGGGGPDKEMMKKIENDAAAFAAPSRRARPQRRLGGEGGPRVGVHHRARGREAQGRRPRRRLAARSPGQDRRTDGEDGEGHGDAGHAAARPSRPIEIKFRDRFLNVITDPNVAYILMMLGMLGLFFELSNPGVILPGVLGGISLILAFFAFQSLPINYAGLLLILFGIVAAHRGDQDREPRRPRHRRHGGHGCWAR